MLNKLVAGAVMVAMVALFLGTGGLAVFTDSEDVTANTFTTGTVDISTAPTTDLVSFSNMAPGDTVTDSIVVTNSGSLALRYAISGAVTAGSAALADQLVLTIKEQDGDGGCDDFDGTTISPAAPNDGLTGSGGLLVGDLSTNSGRNLAASAGETLCFRVELPITTDDTFQNTTVTASFTFDAEQTANNP